MAEYTNGKRTGTVIAEGIASPVTPAVDGLGDVYVNNNHGNRVLA